MPPFPVRSRVLTRRHLNVVQYDGRARGLAGTSTSCGGERASGDDFLVRSETREGAGAAETTLTARAAKMKC